MPQVFGGTTSWDPGVASNTVVTLTPVIETRAVRFITQSANTAARMRLELYGCVEGEFEQ